MSSKIRMLPEHVINVIAAGEVIENPASVVKELVENSVDAGATKIEIDCLAGGFQLIRIEDNGIGMNSDDALLSLERHATSKLSEAEDLLSLTSMGFRGEALASIASISRMTLITAQEGGMGVKIVCEGGKILSVVKTARERGTTIEVQNLFYNVPARKKFQKSHGASERDISKIITRLAIGFPEVSFTFSASHSLVFSTKASMQKGLDRMQARIKELLGEEFVSNTIPLQFQRDDVTLEGFIGLPFRGKTNRSGQLLYINNRATTSEFVEESVKRAYGHSLDSKQFPLFVLHVKMQPHLVDVNVHPQKKEVRFQDELWVDMLFKEAISGALGYQFTAEVPLSLSPSRPIYSEKSAQPPTYQREVYTPPVQTMGEQISFEIPHRFSYLFKDFGFLSLEDDLGSYLMLVHLGRLYQRVLYDSCIKRLHGTELGFSMQKLLFPVDIALPTSAAKDFSLFQKIFQSLGIAISRRGEQNGEVDAIASHIKEENLLSLIEEGIDLIEKHGSGEMLSTETKEEIARLFVKKSRSKEISLNEANQLLGQYLGGKSGHYSPFGEPIFATLGEDELKEVLRSYQKNPSEDGV